MFGSFVSSVRVLQCDQAKYVPMSGFLGSFKKAGSDGLKSTSVSEPVDMRFTIQPTPGESGFSQWVAAMKMVAQLPGGIPPEFRRRLWITMAERHLASRGIEWSQVEKSCFSEWSHPADAELGIQIVKDLHRTGCSLFCGENGQENQALLKKVLLAYARWNKAVGYCQGFNMLAALILQVTDRCESDALKLMIYLIEGLLPDSYFADSLRGLSVDMAVFRELLRSKLPRLSKHLDVLQNAAKDGSRSYEPPLTNVFTMQWFLTLFCNCLPQPTVLRVWDLIFLEGNEILLRTALAIWQVLAQRILVVRTADEFYCVMGALTRELLESNLIDANTLIKAIVSIGPLTELKSLRDHYLYNITPWGTAVPQIADKQINLHPKHSIPLDISALKKQYVKLKQRQRQAHVIFSSAISRQPPPAAPVAMNHLLVGKRALGPSKRPGPPKGSIPPARQVHPSTIHWKDTQKGASSSSSSSDTELCDDEDPQSPSSEEERDRGSNSQFTDNPNSCDTTLMTSDNTLSAASKTSESDAKPITTDENPIRSDNVLSVSPVSIKIVSDSEDEISAEFETFLADRVKCFKETDADVSENQSVMECTRRNSELALQIIQENSLILHRIMQCQSRFSPSPPLLFDDAPETIESYHESQLKETVEQTNVETNLQKMENVYSWLDIHSRAEFDTKHNEPESLSEKQYESRYHSILEKSKSLDERYNSLFSSDTQTEKLHSVLGGLHESKSETPVGCGAEGILNSRLINPLENDFFESATPKKDTGDTLIAPSISDDAIKDDKSSKLIQENLNLLIAFSAKKAKELQQERANLSRKLFQENVHLLESISSEKSLESASESKRVSTKDDFGIQYGLTESGTDSDKYDNIIDTSTFSLCTSATGKETKSNSNLEYFESIPSTSVTGDTSVNDLMTHDDTKKDLKNALVKGEFLRKLDEKLFYIKDEGEDIKFLPEACITKLEGDITKICTNESIVLPSGFKQNDDDKQHLIFTSGTGKDILLTEYNLRADDKTPSSQGSITATLLDKTKLNENLVVFDKENEFMSLSNLRVLESVDKDSAISISSVAYSEDYTTAPLIDKNKPSSNTILLLDDGHLKAVSGELPSFKIANENAAITAATSISRNNVKPITLSASPDFKTNYENDSSCDKSPKSEKTEPTSSEVSPSSPMKNDRVSVKSPSPISKSPTSPNSLLLEEPIDSDGSVTPTKSPSHVFNPFPVSLNSRQNKAVPLKLGLYKKS